MAKNSPNLMKNVQEAKQTPSRINSERLTSRYFIIKLQDEKTQREF